MGGRRPPTQVIPGRPPRGVPVSRPIGDIGVGGGPGIPPRFPRGGRRGGLPSRPGFSCPDPNMTILLADGSQKKAGDLKVGDLIKTYHEKDLEKEGKLARYKSLVLSSGDVKIHSQLIEQLESSYAKASLGEYKVEFVDIVKDVEKIKLTFEGSEIICSLTHKFYVNDSWKEAKDMVIGDKVSDKKLIAIEDVEDGDVVHITIEDAHTYICEGLLSHNKRYAPSEGRGRRGGKGRRGEVGAPGFPSDGEQPTRDKGKFVNKPSGVKGKGRKRKIVRGRRGGRRIPIPYGCPDPNMHILMSDGSQKKAGNLVVGDLIKTNHEKDLKLGEYKIEYIGVLNNQPKTKLIFDGCEIVCSLTHKFYVKNDWKEAKDMVVGDEVSGKKLVTIENVEDGDVIHITVEDAHTYICQGLLSHNKRRLPRPPKDDLGPPPEREVPIPRERIRPITRESDPRGGAPFAPDEGGMARDRFFERMFDRAEEKKQRRSMQKEERREVRQARNEERRARRNQPREVDVGGEIDVGREIDVGGEIDVSAERGGRRRRRRRRTRDFTRKRSRMERGRSREERAAFRDRYVSTLR